MNWLQKIAAKFRGQQSLEGLAVYNPQEFGAFGGIYRSKDFPNVFLGSAEKEDFLAAERIAGQPICRKIDVTNLPEYHIWGEKEQEETQPQFDYTANQLAEIIRTTNCPIYVHCRAGMNRSVSVLAGAISKLTGRKIADVLREIKSQRGQAHPDDAYLHMLTNYAPHDDIEWKEQTKRQLELV